MADIVLQSCGLEKELVLCNTEKEWLCKNYPDLEILKDRIAGKICFYRSCNDIKIVDNFSITIFLKIYSPSILPKVINSDNKIINIAKAINKNLDELHINSDGSFCLTVYPKEKSFFTNGIFNIQEFFTNLLEPYLYWVSFYNKYGKAPWGEYSHGVLGLLEFIAEENLDFRSMYKIIKYNREINFRDIIDICRQSGCLCCKNKFKKNKIRKCHYQAWRGVKKIKQSLLNDFKLMFVCNH
ncbi:hypothetical protein [Campylobacter concisus]|uniref:hypothetical protein n=1 Tax=Campylobacter concisus TaxID=199 RepID=UPI00131E799A|nr:hypothetical protein [Campylobacter concisus]